MTDAETTSASEVADFRAENRIVFPSQPAGFEHGFEQTVLSGPGLQLLNPSHRDAYQDRMSDSDGAVSELYQVNARWRRPDLTRLVTDEEQKELRTWFLESGRRYTAVDGPIPMHQPLSRLPQPLGAGLKKLAEMGQQFNLMFVADVVLLFGGHSWLLPAGADLVVRMRRLPDDVLAQLGDAVPESKRAGIATADMVLALCTVPWRVEVTHGARGYRNAILETGLLLSQTMQVLTQVSEAPTVSVDFVDTVVDQLLDVDGVERFTTALVGIHLLRRPPPGAAAGGPVNGAGNGAAAPTSGTAAADNGYTKENT